LIFFFTAPINDCMTLVDPDPLRTTIIDRVEPEKAEPAKQNDGPASNGFRARLEGLSLFDLVQMECLARNRRVMRVTSAGRVGYLFFRDGDIVHATTRNVTGERAAVEMLGWTDGVFEPCNIVWPEKDTITSSWQNLLMGAATMRDEHAAGKLVHLPNRRAAAPEPRKERDSVPPRSAAVPAEAAMKSSPPSASNGVKRAVRVDPTGKLLSTAGEAPTELVGFAAYAARVAELIGQSLGLEKFQAFEVSFEATRCLLYREDGGNIVVVESNTGTDLGSIARKAGL
jgi:hypothetical protein